MAWRRWPGVAWSGVQSVVRGAFREARGTWRGVVRCGAVLCNAVWSGPEWCGAKWCSVSVVSYSYADVLYVMLSVCMHANV